MAQFRSQRQHSTKGKLIISSKTACGTVAERFLNKAVLHNQDMSAQKTPELMIHYHSQYYKEQIILRGKNQKRKEINAMVGVFYNKTMGEGNCRAPLPKGSREKPAGLQHCSSKHPIREGLTVCVHQFVFSLYSPMMLCIPSGQQAPALSSYRHRLRYKRVKSTQTCTVPGPPCCKNNSVHTSGGWIFSFSQQRFLVITDS